MTSVWISSFVTFLLALAVVTDGALLVRARIVSRGHDAAIIGSVLRQGHEQSTPPEGFVAGGDQARVARTRLGWTVRYTSGKCPFSAQDRLWEPLARELERVGYPVTIVLPQAGSELALDKVTPAGASQLSFVSMDWARRIRVTMTPTVLVFSGDGTLIWHRQGILAEGDAASALQAIRAAAYTAGE